MNNVILTGWINKDIELKKTQGGTEVVNFTLRVESRKKGEPYWIPCVAFGKTAEVMDRYVHKGMRLGVIGHIQTSEYEKDGKKVYTTNVVADSIEFLSSRDEKPDAPINGDLPF